MQSRSEHNCAAPSKHPLTHSPAPASRCPRAQSFATAWGGPAGGNQRLASADPPEQGCAASAVGRAARNPQPTEEDLPKPCRKAGTPDQFTRTIAEAKPGLAARGRPPEARNRAARGSSKGVLARSTRSRMSTKPHQFGQSCVMVMPAPSSQGLMPMSRRWGVPCRTGRTGCQAWTETAAALGHRNEPCPLQGSRNLSETSRATTSSTQGWRILLWEGVGRCVPCRRQRAQASGVTCCELGKTSLSYRGPARRPPPQLEQGRATAATSQVARNRRWLLVAPAERDCGWAGMLPS